MVRVAESPARKPQRPLDKCCAGSRSSEDQVQAKITRDAKIRDMKIGAGKIQVVLIAFVTTVIAFIFIFIDVHSAQCLVDSMAADSFTADVRIGVFGLFHPRRLTVSAPFRSAFSCTRWGRKHCPRGELRRRFRNCQHLWREPNRDRRRSPCSGTENHRDRSRKQARRLRSRSSGQDLRATITDSWRSNQPLALLWQSSPWVLKLLSRRWSPRKPRRMRHSRP